MRELIIALAEFITTPLFRWIFLFLAIVLNLVKYYNEPQRFSYKKAFTGLSYRWHLYLIAVISCISYCFMSLGLWLSVPFTSYLPDNWYIYLFILCMAIITQIAVDSEQVKDDGSFHPPPTYMLPDKYRIMLTYASLVVNIVVMVQTYVYFGIADLSKKSILSRYVLERFGGWYAGNKIDFLYEWSGMLDIFIAVYILYLQYNFQACVYGLPASWNF
jgi:magnesium-transporting ATPase (P-type)